MSEQVNSKHMQGGFTLVELSIVLVIIGLIVGGVLTGQDLINAARVRSTVSQVEQGSTAVNAFRTRFNCVPGDCARATALGLGNFQGDGDGLVEGLNTATTPQTQNTGYTNEPVAFWGHLSIANLIPVGILVGGATPPTVPALTATAANYTAPTWALNVSVIEAKMGGVGMYPVTSQGTNYMLVGANDGNATYTAATEGLSTSDAFNMDTRIDDGNPDQGTVRAIGNLSGAPVAPAPFAAAATGAANCVIAAGGAYNVAVAGRLCLIAARMSM